MRAQPLALVAVPDPVSAGASAAGPVDVVVVTDHRGERHAYFAPASAPRGRRRTVSTEQGIALSDLQHLTRHSQELEQQIRQAVHHARSLGVSWALLGFSTGLAENGARGRFGEPGEAIPGEVLEPAL
jgi:hypothetical protein